jgi:hypothetical protein
MKTGATSISRRKSIEEKALAELLHTAHAGLDALLSEVGQAVYWLEMLEDVWAEHGSDNWAIGCLQENLGGFYRLQVDLQGALAHGRLAQQSVQEMLKRAIGEFAAARVLMSRFDALEASQTGARVSSNLLIAQEMCGETMTMCLEIKNKDRAVAISDFIKKVA